MNSFLNRTEAPVLALLLLIAMIVVIIFGRLAGRKWNKEQVEMKGGVNSLFGALFALSGLILAFTFGMSNTRLQRVRTVVELEANEIGTAILRSDLYADSVREGFRADFRDYLEAVIAFYQHAANVNQLNTAKEDAHQAATRLWARAAYQARSTNILIPSQQMIPALNNMFDIGQTREIVLKSKIPDLILHMLFLCVLAGCFIGGFTIGTFSSREWVIVSGFVLVTTMVVYTTIDLARPLRGFIQDEAGREAIVELRRLLN
jgi:hypothetical protein